MWKRYQKLWMLVLLVLSVTGMHGCGETLPGKIELVNTIEPTSSTAIAMYEKYLYVVTEEGKLISYDVSTPNAPKKQIQVDAFKGPHLGLQVFGSQRMILIGTDGKIALFDLSSPSNPSPVWGQGKTLKLPKVGPFIIRSSLSVMYISPGAGDAIIRVELGNIANNPNATQADLEKGITKIAGDGGGGIVLVRDDNQSPLRLYIGNRKTGKLDIWVVGDIETGSAKVPASSVDIKAGTGIKSIFFFKEKSDSRRGWLILQSDSGALEYLDIGKNWVNASDPKSIATAELPNLFHMDITNKLMLTSELDIYTFTADTVNITTPEVFAKPEVRATLNIRGLIVHKEYLYTAESGGFRVYKYTKNAE